MEPKATCPALEALQLRDLSERIARCLPPNDVACGLRLANKALSINLAAAGYTKVQLSAPLAPGLLRERWCCPGAMLPLTAAQREVLLQAAARTGCVATMQAMVDAAGLVLADRAAVLTAAAAAGHLGACQWLESQGLSARSESVLNAAASSGNLQLLHWVLRCAGGGAWAAPEACTLALNSAAAAGHLAACEWLVDEAGARCTHAASCVAASRGHLQVLRWALQHPHASAHAWASSPTGLFWARFVSAASGGSLATLQYLFDGRPEPAAAAAAAAAAPGEGGGVIWWGGGDGGAQGGEVQEGLRAAVLQTAASSSPDWEAVLQWLVGKGACLHGAAVEPSMHLPDALQRIVRLQALGAQPVSARAAAAAAAAGTALALEHLLQALPAREVLREQPDAVAAAAAGGHLAVLRVLRRHGCPLAPYPVLAAAQHGHLPVVAWLLEVLDAEQPGHSTLRSRGMFAAAARSGSVELCGWLAARGCVWGRGTWAAAARGGSGAVLRWLAGSSCPPQANGAPYADAAHRGDLLTLRLLFQLGAPFAPDGSTFARAVWCRDAARGAPLAALVVLVEGGMAVDWRAAVRVASRAEAGPRGEAVRAWVRGQHARQLVRGQALGEVARGQQAAGEVAPAAVGEAGA